MKEEEENKQFSIGQQIKISFDGAFSEETTGTISNAPGQVLSVGDGWIDFDKREIYTQTKGKKTFYWIVFDSPQFDEVGDGPYNEAEIEISYLELICD